MSRSLYSALSRQYRSRLSAGELADRGLPARRRLYDLGLLPGGLAPDGLAACPRLGATRVAVVGGGFAGLAAAWYLGQCGVRVSVFEASDRLGGRVHSDYTFIPGKVAEAGAELIGANHPMWIELAAYLGLELVEVSGEEDYERAGLRVRMRLGDRDLTDADRKQLLDELEPVIDAIGRDARPVDPVHPWRSPNATDLDRMSVADRLDELVGPASGLARAALEFMLGNDNCAPPANQSYLGLLALVSAGRMGDDEEGMRGY